MSETVRTALFAGAALVAAAFAGFLALPGPTAETAGFEQVGTPFFTAFQPDADADDENAAAGALSQIGRFTITAFDPDTGAIQDFRITRDDATGLYGIAPYQYPAEAAEKLAEVAAGLSAVKRTALKSRREADWADLGVVDPASEDIAQLEGRGLRVELTGDDGNTLADLIIGNPVPSSSGEDRDGYFYVREPRDDSTYIAKLDDLDLSARFADWIDPEVLEIAASDLRRIVVPDETISEQAELVVGDPLLLTRQDAAGDWAAASLPEGKTVDQAQANELAGAATGLTIVGVRPKPKGLKPDLSLDPEVVRSQAQYQAIVRDVTGKGFSILPTADGGAQVLGEAGQLTVVDGDGVAYDLDFGELFTGTTYDFAVGDVGEGYKTLATKKPEIDGEQADGKSDASDEEDEDRDEPKQGRYLFVTARVDPAGLGEAPIKPQPPAEDETEPAEDEEPTNGEEPADDAETARQVYEQELTNYGVAKKQYDDKLADAEERVEELNRRFGDWYYVIDAADVAELSLSPDALLTDAPPALPETGEPETGQPDAGAAGSDEPETADAAMDPQSDLKRLLEGLPPAQSGPPAEEPAAPGADEAPEPPALEPPASESPADPGEAAATGEPMAPREPAPGQESKREPGEANARDNDREPVTAPRPDVRPAPAPEPPADPGDSPEEADGADDPGSVDAPDEDEKPVPDDAGPDDDPAAAE